jgi:hypothetical protein
MDIVGIILKESPEFAQDPEDSTDLGAWHRIARAEEYEAAKTRGRLRKLKNTSTFQMSRGQSAKPVTSAISLESTVLRATYERLLDHASNKAKSHLG